MSKEQKQRNLFKAIYEISKSGKTVIDIDGQLYKQVVLNIAPENLEEIKQWSEEDGES